MACLEGASSLLGFSITPFNNMVFPSVDLGSQIPYLDVFSKDTSIVPSIDAFLFS